MSKEIEIVLPDGSKQKVTKYTTLFELELSNQVQHFIKEDFIRCFPT